MTGDRRWVRSMDHGTTSTGEAAKRAARPGWYVLAAPRILSLAGNSPTLSHALRDIRHIRYANLSRGSPNMLLPSVSVVVPALNEARNIPHVFPRMPPDVHEVILVDGFSVDGTVAVARELRPDVRIVRQTRSGKGNALVCGVAAAAGDIIAMVDADGSADPGEIPRFVAALLDGADFAKGSRFLEGGGSNDITRLRSLGNYLLTEFFNARYGRNYSDLCYGFNVFWRRHASVLGLDATSPPPGGGSGLLWGDGFEVETLIHVRVAKAGLVVAEVPSFEHARIHGVSNLNAFHDGRRVLQTILIERRRTRRPPLTQPPIRLRPGTVVQVVQEGTASSALVAGPEQQATGGSG